MAAAQKTPKTKKSDDLKNQPQVSGTSLTKEGEPLITSFEDEAKIIAEITSKSRELDNEAFQETLNEVRKHVPEVKERVSEPELAKEVKDAGVVNPQQEADQVVAKGPSLDLPLSEEEYAKGQSEKLGGKSVDKSIVGVSSLIALTMWVGRMIKLAHKHAMRVIFKKGNS